MLQRVFSALLRRRIWSDSRTHSKADGSKPWAATFMWDDFPFTYDLAPDPKQWRIVCLGFLKDMSVHQVAINWWCRDMGVSERGSKREREREVGRRLQKTVFCDTIEGGREGKR